MTDVQVTFSLEEAKALDRSVAPSTYDSENVARIKLHAAIRVAEARERDERLVEKVAEALWPVLLEAIRPCVISKPDALIAARAAIAAYREAEHE